MASEEHIRRLKQSVHAWNKWRRRVESVNMIDLSNAKLSRTDLSDADLRNANLSYAELDYSDLSGVKINNAILCGARLNASTVVSADLSGANLSNASLNGANLSGAELIGSQLANADMVGVNLRNAILASACLDNTNLCRADLDNAILTGAKIINSNLSNAHLKRSHLIQARILGTELTNADLTGALLGETVFANLDLANVIGLDKCTHRGPSIVDNRTLERFNRLPYQFLRGVGLPDNLIEYLPALFDQAIQYYSCFISYSTKDQIFADRLYADLQNNGIRCWFAPHDLPIGAEMFDEIDSAIRLRDKLLIILSENSIKSPWVKDEVTTAFEEERKRQQIVLFPIRLDEDVMSTSQAWAAKLRGGRNIGDFRHWRDYDAYKESFDRMVRDLTQKFRG
jgi:uncharacterized protein YjbI with pentapeptide repeats